MKSFLKAKFNTDEDVRFELFYTPAKDYYTLRCLNKNQEMGFLTFQINEANAWLYYVCTHPQYRHSGVGLALLAVFEKYVFDNGVCRIEGKFYPENQFAKQLYDKAGYSIEKDGYDTLVCKNIYENTHASIPEFEKV